MSECTYTEREVVLREREAFVKGWKDFQSERVACAEEDCYQAAARHFPLPTVTRPRVVRDSYNADREWKFVDGKLLTRTHWEPKWRDANTGPDRMPGWTPERVKLLAELIANPNETVPDDA